MSKITLKHQGRELNFDDEFIDNLNIKNSPTIQVTGINELTEAE
jgi:hypothetical protein